MDFFFIGWLFLSLFCLIIASYFDLKQRWIPDKLWLFQISLGIIIDVIWFLSNNNFLLKISAVINISFGLIIGLIVLIFGFMGGGDSKAIFALSISTPIPINYFGVIDNIRINLAIIQILFNMIFGILIFALFLLVFNLLSIRYKGPLFSETSGSYLAKFMILITSRRVDLEHLEALKHEDPIERYIDEKWMLSHQIFQQLLDDEEYNAMEHKMKLEAIQNFKSTNRTYLWVRPQPPGLVFILFGYIIFILFGSPINLLFPIF